MTKNLHCLQYALNKETAERNIIFKAICQGKGREKNNDILSEFQKE